VSVHCISAEILYSECSCVRLIISLGLSSRYYGTDNRIAHSSLDLARCVSSGTEMLLQSTEFKILLSDFL